MSVARTPRVAATPGYSGKPLWAKLGLKAGLRVRLRGAPGDYWRLCGFDAAGVTLAAARAHFDFGHVFAVSRSALMRELARSARLLEADGVLWISWPKKSSGMTTDLTEDTLRELALPLGLVDVKVCAVSDVWSGLKFVWRREQRSSK